jgi:hypothetical protein
VPDSGNRRRTEIEFLNGLVVREGERVGLTCRANDVLTDIVKRVERGEAQARSTAHYGTPTELSRGLEAARVAVLASGHAAATPPSSVMNSRRLN